MLLLELDNVRAGYSDVDILNGLCMEIGPGQMIGVFGPNGCGKSTMVRTILGYLKPHAGSIRFQGINIVGWKIHKIIGLGIKPLFQDAKLFLTLMVKENIELQLGIRSPEECLDDETSVFAELLPDLKALWRKPSRNLSGGQRQKLALSIALHGDVALWIVMDEPSLGLPSRTFDDILKILARKRDKGDSMLVIEHRVYSVLPFCDRAFFLIDGRVALSGKGPELMEDGRVHQVYFDRRRDNLDNLGT
jgi:branched-chain amino acid transport system ATP-binding protein